MHSFHIVQFGYGVLGKAYVEAFKAKGNRVTVVEANQTMVNEYKGKLDILHMTEDLNHIRDVDFIMLMICTPLKDGKLDMSYIYSSIPNVGTILRNNPNALVLIRSTVSPGTTLMYKANLQGLLPSNQNVHIAMQPEFLRAASSYDDALNPWQVIIGHDNLDPVQIDKFRNLYKMYVPEDKIDELNIAEAELMKIFHNSFNACKISYFNSCLLLCDEMNKKNGTHIDMNKIATVMTKTCEGLLNPRYGTKAGHAYWGTCLPKDSAELQNLEDKYNMTTKLFDSVVQVNEAIKKQNDVEILVGDHHMSFKHLSNNVVAQGKASQKSNTNNIEQVVSNKIDVNV
jgi:UDPglucose 6-dehydrogenase